MNSYKLIYLVWLLPAYLLFLTLHQAAVYNGITDTYRNGTSYTAEVLEFELKQIAAQTNGYIVLQFETQDGETVRRKLSLPVEMAGQLQRIRVVPIRYQEGVMQSIVMMPTFDTQKGLVLTNIGMAFLGFVITVVIALAAHRYAGRKLADGHEELVFERVD